MFLLCLLSLLTAVVAAPPTVKDCGGGKTRFVLNALSLSPSNPSPNDAVTLHLDYTVPPGTLVTGGEARYSATYNFIPLTPTVEPLCSNIPCPLGPGRYLNSTVSSWPSGLTGTLTTILRWSDENAHSLLCISIAATL
jgi:hypothetical protein